MPTTATVIPFEPLFLHENVRHAAWREWKRHCAYAAVENSAARNSREDRFMQDERETNEAFLRAITTTEAEPAESIAAEGFCGRSVVDRLSWRMH